MYKTPRNALRYENERKIESNQAKYASQVISGTSPSVTDSILKNLFENQTLRMNMNNFLRILFQALIQEFYPYIVTTLLFMIISFILLLTIFIMILWKEKH